ncbi:MAG: hypothetical protein N2662_07055 [Bacteroidales bacterium]|nr:hypothetical protein [Bacteroidales bacterium]
MKYSDEVFDNFQQFLESFKGDINILEGIVDVDVQLEYFEESKRQKNNPPLDDWEAQTHILFDPKTDIKDKKELLIRLASLEDVKAYRFLEKYYETASDEIKDWVRLAIQESRLLLQSKLLDQPQLLISTGLGGKDGKLRYFIALFHRTYQNYTPFQEKIIRNELDYIFQKQDVIIESMDFLGNYVSVVALFPLFSSVTEILENALREINQYGDFMHEKCIITNVRILSPNDINQIVKQETNH